MEELKNVPKNIIRPEHVVEVEDRSAPVAEAKEKKPGRLRNLHNMDFKINRDNASHLIPFMFFLGVIAFGYIANHHYGEKSIREIDKLRKEAKDLKADYYTSSAKLSSASTQSQITKAVAPIGLKQQTEPPKRLKIESVESNER